MSTDWILIHHAEMHRVDFAKLWYVESRCYDTVHDSFMAGSFVQAMLGPCVFRQCLHIIWESHHPFVTFTADGVRKTAGRPTVSALGSWFLLPSFKSIVRTGFVLPPIFESQ